MTDTLQNAIYDEAHKLVVRHQKYASNLALSLGRKEKRSGLPETKTIRLPGYWSADKGFNPYHVRAHAEKIAFGIEQALAANEYQPRPAVQYQVPKKDGGMRTVAVFQVADNAISPLTFKRLMAKNAAHLSANSYAYRDDLGIHDAILHLSSDLSGRSRTFIAEFDFSKFFDSISHEHIRRVLRDRRFFVTDRENRIIEAFLQSPVLELSLYDPASTILRLKGVPQGTSISLFLANVAAHPLDRQLERIGVGFARYADDTLIWADSYAKICDAVSSLEEIAADMGVEINFLKSEGISLLCPENLKAELQSKSSVSFIGYALGPTKISIRESSLKKAKRHLSYLIYSNLLQAPKKGKCIASRVSGSVDWDYVVMLRQIRRYLYGEMSEAQLRKYLGRQTPRLRFHGLMSFYPVVSDESQLKSLDGWLLNSVHRALRLRGKLFQVNGIKNLPPPHGLSAVQLLNVNVANVAVDFRFPSVARISKLIRRAANVYGAAAVAHQQSQKYHSS